MGICGADCGAKRKWLENKIAVTADTGDFMQTNVHNTVTGKHIFLILERLFQKQSPRGVPRNFSRFTGKHLCQNCRSRLQLY